MGEGFGGSMSRALLPAAVLAAMQTGAMAAVGAGGASYRNPVIVGDYSDPDVLRVGEDYYLVASSFASAPGLPILKSRDLVHWTLVGHALERVPPDAHYSTPRRGGGVWAPAIVHRGGLFRIYYPDPDHGIFVVTAADPAGPWSRPSLVDDVEGAIDPAPFWDDDGTAWLAYAFAASRAGFNNRIALKRMDPVGDRTVGEARTIVDGDRLPPVRTSIGLRPWQTTEGPKLYKRDGWYWLFTPSGSVKGGWQGAFRARSLYGPWEGRDVMDQGGTAVNGPHQGAWVRTSRGEDWFLHFSDADSYGRQVHLQPMAWRDGWPVIGTDTDGDGIGEPVGSWRMPTTARPASVPDAFAGDEFDGPPSPEWQWQSNPQADWIGKGRAGALRLTSASTPVNLWEAGNLLSVKLPGDRFAATARLDFSPVRDGERTGLAMFGADYSWIGLERAAGRTRLVRVTRKSSDRGGAETATPGPIVEKGGGVWLRLEAEPVMVADPPPDFSPYWPSMLRSKHAAVRFSYSLDGSAFLPLGDVFRSRPGRWTGAQIGIFAQAPSGTPSYAATTVGHADYDWFRVGPGAPSLP